MQYFLEERKVFTLAGKYRTSRKITAEK